MKLIGTKPRGSAGLTRRLLRFITRTMTNLEKIIGYAAYSSI